MSPNTVTPEYLSAVAGILISLLASYVIGWTPWWENLAPNHKRLIMLGAIFLVAAGSFGIACAGWGGIVDPGVTCDQAGAIGLARAFIAALIANQATFAISPKRHQ